MNDDSQEGLSHLDVAGSGLGPQCSGVEPPHATALSGQNANFSILTGLL